MNLTVADCVKRCVIRRCRFGFSVFGHRRVLPEMIHWQSDRPSCSFVCLFVCLCPASVWLREIERLCVGFSVVVGWRMEASWISFFFFFSFFVRRISRSNHEKGFDWTFWMQCDCFALRSDNR